MNFGDKQVYTSQGRGEGVDLRDSISRSFISKKELPSIMGSGGAARTNPKTKPGNKPTTSAPRTSSGSAFEDLLKDIDTMNDTFDQDDEEIDEQDFTIFKDNVKKWIEADNRLAELDKQRRELSKRRVAYNEEIVRFMKKYNVEDLNLDDGEMLKFETRQNKGGFNKKQLRENIHNFFIQNLETANKLMSYLEQERKTLEVTKLRRCKN